LTGLLAASIIAGLVDQFDGQVVFVTGASSGIGAALACEFARQGADVVLAARRLDRLEEVAAEVRRSGRRALVCDCDVTRDGPLDDAVRRTRQELGRLDVVVANAGFGVVGPVERLTVDDYRRQFETNVFGVLRTVHATLADVKRARGRIVVVGSVSGHVSYPGGSAYAMSKFAVRALAMALGFELAASGVSVTLASPGFVRSEIHEVDNRGVRHPGTRHTVPWLRMPAERAARIIVRAAARRRREVVVTGHGKAMVLLQRHAPWALAAIIRAFGTRSRREPGAGPVAER
jgi:short-subunit dehydrogenase